MWFSFCCGYMFRRSRVLSHFVTLELVLPQYFCTNYLIMSSVALVLIRQNIFQCVDFIALNKYVQNLKQYYIQISVKSKICTTPMWGPPDFSHICSSVFSERSYYSVHSLSFQGTTEKEIHTKMCERKRRKPCKGISWYDKKKVD